MKLSKLQFENFRSFQHNEIEFPDVPVLVIYDENGRGKTTIQEGVLWGLSGEVFRYTRDDMKSEYGTIDAFYNLRAGEKSRIQLIMELEDSNGNNFVTKINRPRRRKTYLTPSLDLDLKYYINDDHVSQNEFYGIVEDIIKVHPRQFQMTNFLSQEIINEALVTDENIRANVFSKLLSFDWMQEINTKITDEVKTLRKIKRSLQHQKKELTDQLTETEINKLWQDLNEQVGDLQDKGLEFENDNKISSTDYLKRTKMAFELLEKNSLRDSIDIYLDEKEDKEIKFDELKNFHEKLDVHIKDLQKEIGAMKARVESSNNESQEIISSITSYFKFENNTQELDEKITSKIQKRDELDNKITKYKKQRENLDTTLDGLQDLNKKWKKIQDEKEQIIEKTGNLEKIDDELASQEDTVKLLKENKTKLQNNKKMIVLKDDTIKSLENEIKQLDKDLTEFSIKSKSSFLDDLNALTTQINNDIQYYENDHKKDLTEHISGLESLLNGDDHNWEDYITVLEDIKTELERIPRKTTIQQLEDIQRSISTHEASIEIKTKLEGLNESLEEELERIDERLDNYQIREERVNKKIDNVSDRTQYAKPVKAGLLVGLVVFGLSGLLSSGIIQFAMFGIFLIDLILLIGLLLPHLWVNKDLLDTSIHKLLPDKTYLSILTSEREKLRKIITSERKERTSVQERILENQRDIDEINDKTNKIKNLSKEELDVVDKKIDAYENTDSYIETIDYHISNLKELIEHSSTQVLHGQKVEELENVIKELKSSLDKSYKDIEYSVSLDNIKGQLSSKIIELDEKINEVNDLKSKLIEMKVELNGLHEEEKEIVDKLSQEYNIEIEDLGETIKEKSDTVKDVEQKISEAEDELNTVRKNIQELRDEEADYSSKIKSTRQFLQEKLHIFGIDKTVLEDKDQDEIIELVETQFEEVDKTFDRKEQILQQVEQISHELDLLDNYFTNLQLLQKRWNDKQEEINRIEEDIQVLDTKINNIEGLEKSWEVVSDSLQESTENISGEILQVIKKDVNKYFDLLGGHDTLSYVDLEIKVLRNKLNVSINVGIDDSDAGSPKALFSNGEQVSLILSIFFAMSRQIINLSRLKWIGLDEPTQYLDTARKADFIDFIHLFHDNNPGSQLVITTADTEFVQMLDNKSDDIFHVTTVKDISSSDFSQTDYKSTNQLLTRGEGYEKEDIGGTDEVNLPELQEEFLIPSKEDKPKPLGSIDIVDDIPEGKKYNCPICGNKFTALAYQPTCDKSQCIRGYNKTMFNI